MKNLKQRVLEANLDLPKYELVKFTWGNVSEIDRKRGLVVIKPSGVSYDKMTINDMIVVDLCGNIVEGNLKPSSDLPTHLEIYKSFESICSVVHTHSSFATSFAQAGRAIPALGTTHADYFYGEIPVTRCLTKDEIDTDYEKNTGKIIAECFKELNPLEIPGVLVNNHGIFTWGTNANEAVHNAVVLEEIAQMAVNTILLGNVSSINQAILDKHYLRKHGDNAYYGQ